jgi:aerobic-type carbon monoxide dehydrogenase small subunit (CoxS/CutS family)
MWLIAWILGTAPVVGVEPVEPLVGVEPYVDDGRGEWIRTTGLLVPNQALYQAEPRPESLQSTSRRVYTQTRTMPRTIEIVVNGVAHTIDAEPDRALLTALRDELDLTGTKYGCGEGQCGACTVLIDGLPARACQTRAAAVAGRKITTIEGLEDHPGAPGRLHPLQEAFLDVGAMQCGYCTPGMIMSGAALLAKTPNPSDAEILQAMQGNICRCGAYPRIVEAIHLAARKQKRTAA